ncbi:antibiotic biosynthesis monooxygenase [Comamonas humi]
MIVEIADFKIDPSRHDEFGQALQQAAQTVLSKARGYRGHGIYACIETPSRYVLTVHWDSLEDHMEGFRESPAFAQWRGIIGPYFVQPPHVEHFSIVEGAVPQ